MWVWYMACGRDWEWGGLGFTLLAAQTGLEKEVPLFLHPTTMLCSSQKGGIRDDWLVLGWDCNSSGAACP